MPDNSIKAYWRKGVPNRKFAECTGTIARKYFAEKPMSIRDLVTTDEYKKEIAKISPTNEISFSDKEVNQIIDFCNIRLPDDYKSINGRDGHSYDIWIGNGKRIDLWCFIQESFGYVADVINLLVNKAGLDERMYGIRIWK